MDGHLDLIWGRPEWKEAIVSYWKGLIEFVGQHLIEGRKCSSWGVKVGRRQGQRASRVDQCCESEREGTIGLSKNRGRDIGTCGGNAEGVLMWEGGGAWGEEASVGSWERGCSFFGGNRGAGRSDLGCRANTLSFVLLGSPRVRGGNDQGMVVYIDDILINSQSLEEHIVLVQKILQRLREYQMAISLEKSVFQVKKVDFLEYVVATDGVTMNEKKVESIKSWKAPASVRDIQSFIGFANFYQRFIKNISAICAPITNLLKGDPKNSSGEKNSKTLRSEEHTSELQSP